MDSLKNHVQTALTALESSLDPKIWRTKLRVQEIMLEKNPDIKGNPFATHLNHLFTLLIAGVSTGDIIFSTYEEIEGERYEEGEYEPVLKEDIPETTTYGTPVEFCERFYIKKMALGRSYNQVRDELKELSLEGQGVIMKGADKNGLVIGRVFYRKIDTPRHSHTEKLPELPATIE